MFFVDGVAAPISPAAFEAIVSTLPVGSVGFENTRAANGDWFIWIPHDVLARHNRLREPGEDYCDVIRRVVEELGTEG